MREIEGLRPARVASEQDPLHIYIYIYIYLFIYFKIIRNLYSLLFQEEGDIFMSLTCLLPHALFSVAPSGGCRGRLWQLHPRWPAVCRPCSMEARSVPCLCVRCRGSALWRGHLWGPERLYRSHHSFWRVLSHLPSWRRRTYRSALCLYTPLLLIIPVLPAVCSEFCNYDKYHIPLD